MKCSDCEYCYKDYFYGRVWYCCYDGNINYTPNLIDGIKPKWCPFEKENKKEEQE